MVCSCWRVGFFQALLECKKLKICVYFCDGTESFSTLCLIRESEEERCGKNWGMSCRDVCLCMFVSSTRQLIYRKDKQLYEMKTTCFIPPLLVLVMGYSWLYFCSMSYIHCDLFHPCGKYLQMLLLFQMPPKQYPRRCVCSPASMELRGRVSPQ